MRKVDFFIVGAPKCGTTSMATYLNGRSDVFVTNPKEPHYFSVDFPKYREAEGLGDYRVLFAEAKEDQLIGDFH